MGPVRFGIVIQLVRVQADDNELDRAPLIQDIVNAAIGGRCMQAGFVLQPTPRRGQH